MRLQNIFFVQIDCANFCFFISLNSKLIFNNLKTFPGFQEMFDIGFGGPEDTSGLGLICFCGIDVWRDGSRWGFCVSKEKVSRSARSLQQANTQHCEDGEDSRYPSSSTSLGSGDIDHKRHKRSKPYPLHLFPLLNNSFLCHDAKQTESTSLHHGLEQFRQEWRPEPSRALVARDGKQQQPRL